MREGLSSRLASVAPWPVEDDPRLRYGSGLREMHINSVATAFAAADRIARDAEHRFVILGIELGNAGDVRGLPVPSGSMGMLRSMAADASIVLSLLEPPPGHHWGTEMPDAMNARAADPATMLRQMALDPGRDEGECEDLAQAAGAVDVAVRMATSAGQVVAMLTSMGMDIAAHFIDTDDNDGQYLRDAASEWVSSHME